MIQNIIKFSAFTVGIVLVGIGVLYGIQYFRYRTDPEYQATAQFKNLEQAYSNDTYGGDTPEETLRLFIDALKLGDTDLAAKYFIVDKQAEWREDLAKMKEKKLLNGMIKELQATTLSKKTTDVAFFTLVNQDNIAEAQLIIGKNPSNKKWKITEL